MKFLGFILANLGRNRLRTVLTVLGIAVALFLYCFLEALLTGFTSGVRVADADRLITRNAVSLVQPLPIAYLEKIRSVEGVADLSWANWFGGTYEAKRREFFAQYAVEAESYLRIHEEFRIPPAEREAFLRDRQGCLLGATLAGRIGKKPGDRLVLKGTQFPGTWEFNVCGIYTGTRASADDQSMIFHYKYLDERREAYRQGQVGIFLVKLPDASQAAAVARRIDSLFENSAFGTRTETEEAFAMSFVKMMGNFPFLIRFIGAAVVFTILLVSANTMMMSARERTAEIGVLKTIGYPDRTVFLLTMAEACAISLLGGILACVVAKTALRDGSFGGMFRVFATPWDAVVRALLIALATGVVSGLTPAVEASRLRITTALRRV